MHFNQNICLIDTWGFFFNCAHLLLSLFSEIHFNWKLLLKYVIMIILPQQLRVNRKLSKNGKIFSHLKYQFKPMLTQRWKEGQLVNKKIKEILIPPLSTEMISQREIRLHFWTIRDTCPWQIGKALLKALCPSSTVLTSQNPLAKKKHGRLLYLLVQQAAENLKSHLSDQGIGSGQALSLSRPDSVLLNWCFFHKKKKQ